MRSVQEMADAVGGGVRRTVRLARELVESFRLLRDALREPPRPRRLPAAKSERRPAWRAANRRGRGPSTVRCGAVPAYERSRRKGTTIAEAVGS